MFDFWASRSKSENLKEKSNTFQINPKKEEKIGDVWEFYETSNMSTMTSIVSEIIATAIEV